MLAPILKLFDRMVFGAIYTELDLHGLSKARISVAVVITIPPFLAFWGAQHLASGNFVIGSLNILLTISLVVSYMVLRRTYPDLDPTWVYRLNVGLGWIILVAMVINGAIISGEVFWLFIYPPIAFLIMGCREGLVWVSTLFLTATLLVLFPEWYGREDLLSTAAKMRFVGSFFLVGIVSYTMESARQHHQRTVEEHEQSLIRAADENARARETAELANRAKTEFLANMSHELRTPLNTVIGCSQILEDERFGLLNEKQHQYMRHIEAGGQHLLRLISEILDLSSIEAGMVTMKRAPVKLDQLIENTLKLLGGNLGSEDHSVEIHITPELAVRSLDIDEARIQQVITNLISNAIKFSPETGSIHLSVSEADDYVIFTIEDFGVGIDPEEQDQVFTQFFQARLKSPEVTPGMGLGLTISKRLIELHDGRIWVESEGIGKGSRFSFSLPK